MILTRGTAELFRAKNEASLPELLEGGRLPALFSGLPAAARAHLAAVARAETDRPLLIVCPDEAAAEPFARDLSGLLETPVPVLAARDYTFYTAVSVSRQTEQRRLGALYALASGEAKAVVATVSGLLQRAMPKKTLLNVAFTITERSVCAPEDAEDALLRCGYVRTQQVEGPGQFSRRGGILDLFSPSETNPVRIEFWGDEIDSMGYFEIESQRRVEPVKTCRILPAAETLPTLYPGGTLALAEKLSELSKRAARRKNETLAANLARSLQTDAEALRAGLELHAADRYMAMIYGEYQTAADMLDPETVVLIDQPGRCGDRARDFLRQLSEDVGELVAAGTMAVRAEQFARPWTDVMRTLAGQPLLFADGFRLGHYPISTSSSERGRRTITAFSR